MRRLRDSMVTLTTRKTGYVYRCECMLIFIGVSIFLSTPHSIKRKAQTKSNQRCNGQEASHNTILVLELLLMVRNSTSPPSTFSWHVLQDESCYCCTTPQQLPFATFLISWHSLNVSQSPLF